MRTLRAAVAALAIACSGSAWADDVREHFDEHGRRIIPAQYGMIYAGVPSGSRPYIELYGHGRTVYRMRCIDQPVGNMFHGDGQRSRRHMATEEQCWPRSSAVQERRYGAAWRALVRKGYRWPS